ncbi:hypothetical protein SAMN05216421_1087 [Halopseudomonas xinjiangensis]|uniref:DnaT DNA-binding domain-containing protein n=2 Tax=Halopseudomonas xinjiangensis TaxID=487184 RepID=A0A1H1Q9N8_9GAMM|nr:hypothetical protein SAMN05216421_1087 [Halopseudomonas xinjiangensis]
MAGDWIKFEMATLDKPEVCQIADMADIDVDAVVGKLLRVWTWFDQQTAEGNAPSVTKRLLDRLVGVTGFCEHMKAVGWMHEAEGVISLPNFARHNGKTAKNRAQTAKRVSQHKTGNAKGNGGSVTKSEENALPREEKRRDINPSHTPRDAAVPFAMYLDWQPDPNTLAAYCRTAGMTVDQFTQEAIGPFICHHEARGTVKSGPEHTSALVAWVKRDAARDARVVPFAGRSSRGPDLDDRATGWLEER